MYDKNGTPLVTGTTGYDIVDHSTTSGVLETTPEDNNRLTTLRYSIKHPFTFLWASLSPYDWYTNNKAYGNNALWGKTKTIYDPCPKGWKLAEKGAFNDFTGANTGWNYEKGGASVVGEGTFPFYHEGNMLQAAGKVTCGRLYRDGTSVTATPIAWFPSGGYRSTTTQSRVLMVGNEGSEWLSSRATVSSGVYMRYISNWLNPNWSCHLSEGLYVRCVKE